MKQKRLRLSFERTRKENIMPHFKVTIHHFRKPACLNPEEPTTLKALHQLRFAQIGSIQMGGCFVLTINALDSATAEKIARDACEKFLVNPVTNQFNVEGTVEVQATS